MKIDDKVRIIKEICANNCKNPHYNRIATIIEIDSNGFMICVSIDDFPNCNHRKFHNRFWYTLDEIILL